MPARYWDPHSAKDRSTLESVHKFALRMSTRQWDSSDRDLLNIVCLPSLESRRRVLRLSTLFKIKNQLIFFPKDLFTEQHSLPRLDREQRLLQPFAKTLQFCNSFVPRTIRDWNKLSVEQVQATMVWCCAGSFMPLVLVSHIDDFK